MTLRLIFVYLFCVIPICIWNIMFSVRGQSPEDNMALSGILLYCLYWLQYGINWIIYFFNNPRYRRAFKQLISCILRKDLKPIRQYPRQMLRRTKLPNRIFIVSDRVPSIVSGIHGVESSSHSHRFGRAVKFDMDNNHHPTGTMFYQCESPFPSLDSDLSDYTETDSCTSQSRFHFSMMYGYSEENISNSMDSDDNTECCNSLSIPTAGNDRRRHSSCVCRPGVVNSCQVLSRKCSM